MALILSTDGIEEDKNAHDMTPSETTLLKNKDQASA